LFNYEISSAAFDLPMNVTGGQVFRWRELEDGRWLGVDGGAWFSVRTLADRYLVESNQPEQAFVRLFSLDVDLQSLHGDLLARGPELAPYVKAFPGLRLVRTEDPVEGLFSFLCTPNNHIKRIAGMVRYLASVGPMLDTVEGEAIHRFPSLELIFAIPEETLRAAGFGYRAATIPKAAGAILESGGHAFLEQIQSLPFEEAHEGLQELPGVGPKLADCILLFAFHRTEAVPVDTHIWQAAIRHYFPEWQGTDLTGKKYTQIGAFMRERFGSHAGWAQQFLFHDNMLNWRTRRSQTSS